MDCGAGDVTCVDLSHDMTQVAVSGIDAVAQVWNVASGECIWSFDNGGMVCPTQLESLACSVLRPHVQSSEL